MATYLKSLSDFSHLEVSSAENFKFGIVVAQWNVAITGALFDGAYQMLLDKNVAPENIKIIQVPGSFELISGANMLLNDSSLDAVICLGCVIHGENRHFDFICDAVANGLDNVPTK